MSQNRSLNAMRPAGAGAVMQQRATRVVAADNAQRAQWRALDFFPTPPWAARAGAELVKRLDPEAQTVWEPACGEGHMAHGLRDVFDPTKVIATDIHNYTDNPTWDFLSDKRLPLDGVHWIVTNPPFLKAAEFAQRGLEVAARGVAVLCRAAFLESAGRYPLLFQGPHPLTAMAPFIERVPMQLGVWDPQGSTATAYAWFLFDKKAAPGSPVILPIPPGTRARLTKDDDAARFGAQLAWPLFQGESDAIHA